MNNIKICAIVVTYNRKDELKKQLETVIFNQKYKVDSYYIVDNCSTDGTELTIKEYENNGVLNIKYLKTSYNCGGAGGFSFGLMKAFEDGYDWYILMDDDGKPYNDDCFLNMYNYILNNNFKSSDLYLLNSLVQSDDKYLSFGLGHIELVDEALNIATNNIINNKINPFNGTWISNGLIDKIGYPNKDFFIKGDENDYLRRAIVANATVYTITNSVYFHPRLKNYKKKKLLWKEMYVYIEAPWKEYYNVRNYTYSVLQFNNKKQASIYLMKRIFCCMVCKCKKIKVLKMLIKGYIDGKKGRLGATIRP